jgi:hypothetical protein
MRQSIVMVTILMMAVGSSAMAKSAGNRPYAVAFRDSGQSPFYARCIPVNPLLQCCVHSRLSPVNRVFP